MMRIITGTARGTKLETPDGMNTRPTSERAKEAVFSCLQFGLRGKCVLDLFAGSGQMGLEALSRGAGEAYFCDMSAEAIAAVKKNAEKTHLADCCRIFRTDAVEFLCSSSGTRRFDIVFIDPPYALGLVPKCLELLADGDLLAEDGIAVCETARDDDPFGDRGDLSERFTVIREAVYGAARVTLVGLAKKGDAEK